MPIFTTTLRQFNYNNPTEATKAMANHIRQLQEELEFALLNLDSTNISTIDLKQTKVITSSGTALTDGFVLDCGEWD